MTANEYYILGILRQPYHRVLTPEDEGGYSAKILEFPGCFAEGNTADEAMTNLEHAAQSWLLACAETNRPIPEPLIPNTTHTMANILAKLVLESKTTAKFNTSTGKRIWECEGCGSLDPEGWTIPKENDKPPTPGFCNSLPNKCWVADAMRIPEVANIVKKVG